MRPVVSSGCAMLEEVVEQHLRNASPEGARHQEFVAGREGGPCARDRDRQARRRFANQAQIPRKILRNEAARWPGINRLT